MHTWRAAVFRPLARLIRSRLTGALFPSSKASVKLGAKQIARVGKVYKAAKPTTLFARLIARRTRAGTSSHVRALALGLWRQSTALRGAGNRNNGLYGFNYVKHLNATTTLNTGIFERVRDLFSDSETEKDNNCDFPRNLAAYELGSLMAVGCNAAVYEAKFVQSDLNKRLNDRSQNVDLLDRKENFNLAVKMAFNYHATSNEQNILREMSKEMVPVLDTRVHGQMRWDRPLSVGHANIAKVYTAFVDLVPDLKDAAANFCWAMPPTLNSEGAGYSRTLFLVMKRYTMTLKEYLTWQGACIKNTRTPTILFSQLLEALVFLHANNVVHRDMKSNNILVDFDVQNEPPHLVLCDFGCCLSEGTTMTIPYAHMDQDLGGNLALLPPEIKNQTPGYNKFLDYTNSDLWAAGTMAYEIYIGINPFYMQMNSQNYSETDLPVLHDFVPKTIQRLVGCMLKIDPKLRPSVACCATVVGLSLSRISEQLLFSESTNGILKRVPYFVMANINRVLLLFSAETLLWRNKSAGIHNSMSKAELQVRKTLLTRIDLVDLNEAVTFLQCEQPEI